MRRLFAAFALLLFLPTGPALAEERILDFDSRLEIRKDGSLDVTETIRVNAENVDINRGIYREFPTRYDGRRGERIRVGFKLLETRRDGRAEPSTVESAGNGVRIRIGNPDVIIPVGQHVYSIRYRTTRQLGYFDGYDELYWNVTGNGWKFPIDRASATILLPSPAQFGERATYTGAQGSTASSAQVGEQAPGRIRFETTAPLAPYEGLTVAAAFPKGVVASPSATRRARWLLADWAAPLVALLGLTALGAFLLRIWRRVGRNPPAGTVVPIFAPPDGLSPAAMRYVVEQKLDDRGFAAALVDAAVKGHVRLVEDDGGILSSTKRRIERLAGTPATPLEEAESKALDALVPAGGSIELDNEKHAYFGAALKALSGRFDKRFVGTAFHRNTGWAFAALGAWFAVLWATAATILIAEGTPEAGLALAAALLFGLASLVWVFASKRDGALGCLLKGIPFLLAAIGAVLAFPILPLALETGRWLPLAIAALGLPFALSAFAWIDAPTRAGRAMLDRIAGFRQYLSITEAERLDRMHAPQDDIATFERYLPYAIALGVENRWADRFSSQLAAAQAAGQSGFSWYSGSHSPWSDSSGFVESISSSLSASISSASTAPGTSSGSSGGGSSGGGGGGGGGGGW